jgi:hypothetical protein
MKSNLMGPPVAFTPEFERNILSAVPQGSEAIREHLLLNCRTEDDALEMRQIVTAHFVWMGDGRKVYLLEPTVCEEVGRLPISVPRVSSDDLCAFVVRLAGSISVHDAIILDGWYTVVSERGVSILPIGSINGVGTHLHSLKVFTPDNALEPYAFPSLIPLFLNATRAILDERIGRIKPWAPRGPGERRALAGRGTIRRLTLAPDATHVLRTEYEQAVERERVARASGAHAPPAPHVVPEHNGIRWCRLDTIGLDAAIAAAEAGRLRFGETEPLYGVPRPIREHVRGSGTTAGRISRVVAHPSTDTAEAAK